MRLARLGAWLAGLGAAIAALALAGNGPLAGPDLLAPATWGAWAQAHGPAVTVVALLRLLALALAWYLVAATFVGVAARVSGRLRLIRLADAVSIPLVRRVLGSAFGVGLATALAAGGSPAAVTVTAAAPAAAAPGPPAMMPLPPTGTTPPAPAPPPAVDPPAMARLPATATPPDGAATPSAHAGESPADAPGPTGPTDQHRRGVDEHTSAPREHTVAPGEHLWSIAEAALATVLGRAPADEETAPYWRAVVEINRERLVDPANPDLLYPGQVVVLPPTGR